VNSILKNIIRFALFLLLQIVVLNEVPPVHRFIIPYLYFLYILWLPFSMNRFSLLIVAFLFGLSLDYFTGTIGLHAAPCVLIAYIRPYLLNLLLPQETIEQSYAEPGVNSMGWAPYAVYVGLLTFIHHFYLVLIEWLQFGDFVYFLGKVIGTTLVSFMMIILSELLFLRKGKYRTNAA